MARNRTLTPFKQKAWRAGVAASAETGFNRCEWSSPSIQIRLAADRLRGAGGFYFGGAGIAHASQFGAGVALEHL